MINQLDTLYVSNGNVTDIHVWMPNNAGTADSLEGTLKFGYGGTANPPYHSNIATAIGPLLYVLQVNNYGGPMDPISTHLFTSVSETGGGIPAGISINFNTSTDSKGRVKELSASVFGMSEALI